MLSSAALVKLKLPVTTTARSTIMTLLWAMAWWASIAVGMPEWRRKSASEYFSVRWLLSRITATSTPRWWASARALAIGVDVKL